MSLGSDFLAGVLATGRAIHPLSGRDMTDEICLAMQEIREEELATVVAATTGVGQAVSVTSRTGLRAVADMPALVERQFEADLGKGCLKDEGVRKALAKFHPEYFPKEGYQRRLWTGASLPRKSRNRR